MLYVKTIKLALKFTIASLPHTFYKKYLASLSARNRQEESDYSLYLDTFSMKGNSLHLKLSFLSFFYFLSLTLPCDFLSSECGCALIAARASPRPVRSRSTKSNNTRMPLDTCSSAALATRSSSTQICSISICGFITTWRCAVRGAKTSSSTRTCWNFTSNPTILNLSVWRVAWNSTTTSFYACIWNITTKLGAKGQSSLRQRPVSRQVAKWRLGMSRRGRRTPLKR